MNSFEELVAMELERLQRAAVPPRGIRLTVRELVVTRIERGPLGAREIGEAVESALAAACRMVRERQASEDMVETVLEAALEAVRGHGGESARWIAEARQAALGVLDQMAREYVEEPTWRWLAGRIELRYSRS